MKRVYIAGPYRASTVAGIRANIDRAASVARRLWAAGFGVFCPHMNSAFMDGAADDGAFIRFDLAALEWCDFVVMMNGWEFSEGAQAERRVAEHLEKPVYYTVADAIRVEQYPGVLKSQGAASKVEQSRSKEERFERDVPRSYKEPEELEVTEQSPACRTGG